MHEPDANEHRRTPEQLPPPAPARHPGQVQEPRDENERATAAAPAAAAAAAAAAARRPERDEPQEPDADTPARREAAPARGPLATVLATIWAVAGVLVAAAAAVYVLQVFGVFDDPRSLRDWAGSLLVFENDTLWSNALVFVLAATAVWMAGTKLSEYADVIGARTGLSGAFVGLLLLATATSLPELATTVTAGTMGNAELLSSNLLGGIVMQTAVLAAIDLLLVRRRPLTYFTPDPKLLIDGVMLVGLLGLVVVAIAFGAPLAVWGMSPWSPVLLGFFLLILWVTHSQSTQPRWEATNPPGEEELAGTRSGDGGDGDRRELDGEGVEQIELQRHRETSNRGLYLRFAAGSAVILMAGFLVTRTSDAMAQQLGLSNTFAGAILVAITTSLPEVSTTSKAIRLGAYSMAFANIFGSNGFCVALFFVGDIAYRQGPIFEATPPSALYLTGLGIIVTCAYLWGLLERKDKTFQGMGIASGIVLFAYVGGMILLYTVML